MLKIKKVAYSFAFALMVNSLAAQPTGPGGMSFNKRPLVAQNPDIIIRQAFSGPLATAPRVWVSGGGPAWAVGVASTGIPNTRPSEATQPGGMDAVKMPDGRTLIFTTTMYNRLHVMDVKPGYSGSQETYCFSGEFTYSAGQLQNRGNLAARAVKVSPDGKTLYVLLGAPKANSGLDEYLYAIPISDCSTKCLDVNQIKEIKLPKTVVKGGYFDLAFHPKGNWLVATGYSDEILVLNPVTVASHLITLPAFAGKSHSVNSPTVSPRDAVFNFTSGGIQLSSAIYIHGQASAMTVVACNVIGPHLLVSMSTRCRWLLRPIPFMARAVESSTPHSLTITGIAARASAQWQFSIPQRFSLRYLQGQEFFLILLCSQDHLWRVPSPRH